MGTLKPLTLTLILSMAMFAQSAQAQACDLSISGDDMIQYDKSELRVPADCDSVTLTLTHSGELPVKQMGHNWVLTGMSVWQDVATAGVAAGEQNGYVPPNDDRIITHTDMIGGGESTSITFDVSGLDRDRDYKFFCSFPGHYAVMNGRLVLETEA